MFCCAGRTNQALVSSIELLLHDYRILVCQLGKSCTGFIPVLRIQSESGSSFLGQCGSGSEASSRSGSKSRDYDQKLKKINSLKKFHIILIKLAIYLSLGLHKWRASNRRSLQPSKENMQHFKTWNFFTFSFLCILFALSDPDPDPADQNQCGSGSATLIYPVLLFSLYRNARQLRCDTKSQFRIKNAN